MTAPESVIEQDGLLSGGIGKESNSARAGFIPVPLARIPTGQYQQIPFFLRRGREEAAANEQSWFRLFRGEDVSFTEEHRQRLSEHGLKFVYIRIADHTRFRLETEARLSEIASDPAVAISEKSAIIYETSVELMNELLSEPDLAASSPRLGHVARAVTTLAISDSSAFSHLFAASHHDFYTATHMVNVGTWMVPLAFAMGYTDSDELRAICMAGFLHDIGKVAVPEDVLNKPGKLTDEEWAEIKRHPEMGERYLCEHNGTDELLITVVRQHHERLDGSGYPNGLTADEIQPVSKMCAVVDSFDAMTAFRPFKSRTLSVDEALNILWQETPQKYDPDVTDAWFNLLRSSDIASGAPQSAEQATGRGSDRRQFPRVTLSTPGRVHTLEFSPENWCERPGIPIVADNISMSGVGFLCRRSIEVGEAVHVYLQGEKWDRRCLKGTVVRGRSHQDGWHQMGVHFDEIQPDLDWIADLAECPLPGEQAS